MEKNNNLEIVPGKGYGNFLFDVEYAKVIEMIGDPDEVIQNEDDEDEEYVESLTAFFDDYGLAMFFEQIEESGPLTLQSIEIDEPTATMYGKSVFGMNKTDLIKLIEKETGEKAVVDADEDFEEFELIDFDKSGISLQLENDELVSITLYNLE
jgi:hypothetical protein